ncbi:MAG: EAL domain-containing protein, partial [Pseudomonadota bacterium]
DLHKKDMVPQMAYNVSQVMRQQFKNINDVAITQAMIGLGNNLRLAIVAEGVEYEQQMQILLDHQCHLQQGYYFSRPVPYESFLQLINESNEVSPTSIRRLCNEAGLH